MLIGGPVYEHEFCSAAEGFEVDWAAADVHSTGGIVNFVLTPTLEIDEEGEEEGVEETGATESDDSHTCKAPCKSKPTLGANRTTNPGHCWRHVKT